MTEAPESPLPVTVSTTRAGQRTDARGPSSWLDSPEMVEAADAFRLAIVAALKAALSGRTSS
jgi:hypothetical protein